MYPQELIDLICSGKTRELRDGDDSFSLPLVVRDYDSPESDRVSLPIVLVLSPIPPHLQFG